MKFFGVHIADVESERFMSASNDQIAAWLFLHTYCSKQDNWGKIENAAAFDGKFWGRLGIDKSIIDSPSPFWSWQGSDLVLHPYDEEGQRVYEKKVEGGRAGGKAKAERWKKTHDSSTPRRSPSGSPSGSPSAPYPTRPNHINSADAEMIYKAYPKKVARGAALKAIGKALKCNSLDFLLERTQTYAKAVAWQETKFIPHPATWFNQERFKDDPAVWEDRSNSNSSTSSPDSSDGIKFGNRTYRK